MQEHGRLAFVRAFGLIDRSTGFLRAIRWLLRDFKAVL
jgi:hypothetical protein